MINMVSSVVGTGARSSGEKRICGKRPAQPRRADLDRIAACVRVLEIIARGMAVLGASESLFPTPSSVREMSESWLTVSTRLLAMRFSMSATAS